MSGCVGTTVEMIYTMLQTVSFCSTKCIRSLLFMHQHTSVKKYIMLQCLRICKLLVYNKMVKNIFVGREVGAMYAQFIGYVCV